MKRNGTLASVLAGIVLAFVACNSGGGIPAPPRSPSPVSAGTVIDVRLGEEPHVFMPDSFDLKLGQTYQISIKGGSEFHTFTVADLGVDKVVAPGQTALTTIVFMTKLGSSSRPSRK